MSRVPWVTDRYGEDTVRRHKRRKQEKFAFQVPGCDTKCAKGKMDAHIVAKHIGNKFHDIVSVIDIVALYEQGGLNLTCTLLLLRAGINKYVKNNQVGRVLDDY